MLQFVGTYPTGTIGMDSGIWQIVDVSPYADSIANGDVAMSVTAQFNRIIGDDETDTEVGFFLNTMASMPDQYPGYSQMDTFFSDSNPNTWETHASSLPLPQNTNFVLVGLLVLENIFDDDTIQSSGGNIDLAAGYVDSGSVAPPGLPTAFLPQPRTFGVRLNFNL